MSGTPQPLPGRIAAHARERTAGTVAEVRIGLGYTAVRLDNNALGVAFTFSDRVAKGCTHFRGLRPLAGRAVAEVLPLLDSDDVIEAAVGLACANAVINTPGEGLHGGDVLQEVQLGPDDDVAMVGRFGPLVGPVRKRARSLTIFERIEQPCGDLRPVAEADEVLGRCHVALITGTSIINHTADRLLEAARSCREVVVLGASTPLAPEVFRDWGATLLSGVVVHQPAGILQVVSEGGGMALFGPYLHKVNVRVSP